MRDFYQLSPGGCRRTGGTCLTTSAHFGRTTLGNGPWMWPASKRAGFSTHHRRARHIVQGVLLVIIGKRWLSVTDNKGKRRLDGITISYG